jgi:hypothetical protein
VSKKRQRLNRGPAAVESQHTARRSRWLAAAAVLAAVGILAVWRLRGERAAASASPALPAPPAASDPAATSPEAPPLQKLVGRCRRSDYDYVIDIRGVAPDGRLDARYLNPNPINVSRAEAKRENGRLTLLVEMRDRNYPGSYYTLVYDPGGDTLSGVYHHLGLQQEFEVAFSRSRDERSAPKGAP